MIIKEVTIINPAGLHARPAHDFIRLVKTLNCKVEIENIVGKKVDASSLLKVLSLGITGNSNVKIYCEGEEEEVVMEQIVSFFKNSRD